MKADIKRDGYLHIIAETELEGFALAAWYDNWMKSGNDAIDKAETVVINSPAKSKYVVRELRAKLTPAMVFNTGLDEEDEI